MRITFTGRGTSGSWQIRGVQIADALRATARPMVTSAELAATDIVVAVKRVPEGLLSTIRKSRKPWVWDVVDAYPQRECGAWTEEQSKDWLKRELDRMRPSAVIWPTQRMMIDSESSIPGRVINHHHRLGIDRNAIRREIREVGYEGSVKYLVEWEEAVRNECDRIGARFVLNPNRLADLDVVVALRGSCFNGYPQRMWKSNVKLANAQGSGTPVICGQSEAYAGTADSGVRWANTREELRAALDELAPQTARRDAADKGYAAKYGVEDAAADYKEFLCELLG